MVINKLARFFGVLVILTGAVSACAPHKSVRKQIYETPPDRKASIRPQSPDLTPGKLKTSKPYRVDGKKYYPLKNARGFSQKGVASWYGPDFDGKATANGETYDQMKMTAAHKTLPFNTILKVKNLDNGKSILVRVNDRGPFAKDRIIDLSKKAAMELGMISTGTARVKLIAVSGKRGRSRSPRVYRE